MAAPAHLEIGLGGPGGERGLDQPRVARAPEQHVVALVLAQLRMGRAVQEDQRLDGEFEVDDAARDVLDVVRRCLIP
jgi:hypothetical protein